MCQQASFFAYLCFFLCLFLGSFPCLFVLSYSDVLMCLLYLILCYVILLLFLEACLLSNKRQKGVGLNGMGGGGGTENGNCVQGILYDNKSISNKK